MLIINAVYAALIAITTALVPLHLVAEAASSDQLDWMRLD
jgi:hypothetical protein